MNNHRHLIITGASRGLGQHIAEQAALAGYSVTGLSRNGGSVNGIPIVACDVTDSRSVARCFSDFRDLPLWALINAAGVASMNLHIATPPTTMNKIVSCNLLGSMYCAAEAGRLLIRRKAGRIINFSSIAVPLGLAGEASYVASKAGIEGFTRAFAREIAPFGVTVNAVSPGPVPTKLTSGVPEGKLIELRRRQVMPRALTADDVWDVVSWLLEDRANCISGEVIHVGGA